MNVSKWFAREGYKWWDVDTAADTGNAAPATYFLHQVDGFADQSVIGYYNVTYYIAWKGPRDG